MRSISDNCNVRGYPYILNNMLLVERGRSIKITGKYYDNGGTLIDPTSPAVAIYNESGTSVTTGTPTKASTGVYYYIWNTTGSTTIGIYIAEFTGTNGTYTVADRLPVLVVEME